MPSEKELLERIRQLEHMNSELQDKLDMIYAILAPDYEEGGEDPDGAEFGAEDGVAPLVQINGLNAIKGASIKGPAGQPKKFD